MAGLNPRLSGAGGVVAQIVPGCGDMAKSAAEPSVLIREPAMPFKANAERRRHIAKQKRKVTNWAAYDASLRQRGSLTVWFSDEAIAAWRAAPRTTRGAQPWYSPLAILTALTLRAVFWLALRQTEGLIGSIVDLLRLALAVPDHSTLSRRAQTLDVPRPRSGSGADGEPVHLLVDSTGLKLCGAGEWLREHAILWGSLRRQCDCFTAIRGAEAGIATTEGVLERIVQRCCSHVEEGLHRRPVPAHLLFFVHAFGDDLVDRTLHERGRDRFAIAAPGGVMDQRSLVPLEVGQQHADVVFQAPDICHAAYRCPPRPAA
jgi:hypothetical protein